MNKIGEKMKKLIIILFIITVCYAITNNNTEILIPDESIRFRVIANSNSEEDQNLKIEIKNAVEKEMNRLMTEAKTIEEARNLIKNDLDKIHNIVKNYNVSYQMNFGENYFPEKIYKGVTYKEGNYESLVITLGNGTGKNWWCVMFPPLCLLEAEETNLDDVKYESYVKKILEKYL